MAPSPKVLKAAWALRAYVRREIRRGMGDDKNYFSFSLQRPAGLHDELAHFLAVYDPDAEHRGRNRG